MNHATRHRRLLSLVTALSLSVPAQALAGAAPGEDAQDLVAFEAGFKEGQAKFDGGAYLEAARTWIAAAAKLGEKLRNRDNRTAVYEYVADAFTSGLQGEQRPEALREAAEALGAYCDGFTRAYGTETPISAKITAARDDFKARLAEAEAAQAAEGAPRPGPKAEPQPQPPPAEQADRSPKWKGLVIAGGVLAGVGLGMGALAAIQGGRGKQLETEYLDMDCRTMTAPKTMNCQDLKADGEASNTGAVRAALLAAPLLAVGVTLLAIGLKRRSKSRTAFAPALAPGFAGIGLQGSF